jgi:RimJ/RimL family protein N-acetyltransferase
VEVEVRKPFPFEALPRIWRWIEPFRSKVSDDFAPQTLQDFLSSMAAKWDHQASWAVCVEGEIGGLITFERLTPWLGTAHLVLKPDFQGRGIAVKACRTAVAEMFADGVGKLAFYPLAGNLAIGSLLINIGAKREGRLAAHTLCGGKPTDVLLYGLTKGDFENASSGNRAGNVDFESCGGRSLRSGERVVRVE